METIAILGTGLMGSSLGLALRKREVPVRIHVYARRAETREAALNLGIADEVFSDPSEAVRRADLIVFCVPVLTISELAKACRAGLKPGAVLTDVGSTKEELNRLMIAALEGTGAEFIGSHPICGSEQQGIEAGDADLYAGAMTVVTPPMLADEVSVRKVSNLWKSAGSHVTLMEASQHDRILAATSHLPHVIAAALALSAGDNGLFCGSGFRDTTRIADGSPQVWSDIVRTNAPALKAALKNFRENLDELSALVDEGDGEKLANWFAAARDKRKELLS
ncbi:MAG: prephenate dehydrogenase/arogenate dehydrogenase family protein [Verrucomicrobia bacterium]|nr:prephenate dehydrogenase/arogenate dehydrogenase family protein [Verrucomicrobiota bacterium]